MSDTLTALIAFAGIMMLLSMLVTSLRDGLKNLMGLKTNVWKRFFIGIYKYEFGLDTQSLEQGKIDQEEQGRTGQEEQGKNDKGNKRLPFVGEYENRLKRLRNVIVQAEKPLTALRNALENIGRIDPAKEQAAREIGNNLARLKKALVGVKGLRLDWLLAMYAQASKMDIQGFYDDIRWLEKQFPAIRGTAQNVGSKVVADFVSRCKQMDDFIDDCEDKLSEYRMQIEKKADAWLAQLNQEYKKNMLKWSVIIGWLLVLAFNADSFTLFRFLLNDVEGRETVVAAASQTVAVTQKARVEKINAIDQAIREGRGDDATRELEIFLKELASDFEELSVTTEKPKIDRLLERLRELDADASDRAENLQDLYDETVPLFALLQKDSLDNQLEHIAELDLPLGWQQEIRRWSETSGCRAWFFYVCSKIGGLFLTSVLITFGAPFWKDVMNALVGLKKAIPQKSSLS